MAGALLALGACTAGQGPEQIGPLFSHMFGPAFEGRERPPHADAESPNLGTVPPRPTVPDIAVRDALTAALAEERQRSRNPLDAEMRPVEPRPAGTEGDRSMPMRAPTPPPLAAAPRITWDPVDPIRPAAPAAQPVPAAPPAGRRAAPATQPAPEAAPAAPDMATEPPASPPAELLTPSGPPPLPSQDLLAPRTR